MSAVVCGLDVHKESTYAIILDPDGEVLAQRRMKSEDIPGFLEPFGVDRVAMEASTYIIPSTGGWSKKGTTSRSATRRRRGTSRRPESNPTELTLRR